jgi:hypothetical protein
MPGNPVFTGAGGTTALLAAEVALEEPPEFDAVTATRSVWPTSASTGV